MAIIIQKDILHDFSLATQREWLETNGLGGWASSTVIGAHTRRYHGILVAADGPPVVLLSKLDEIIHADGRVFELGCNRYPGNLHPRGNLFMHLFSKDPFPLFEYRVRGITVRKTIAALNGENTTIVLYEISGSESPIVLELVPLIAARNIHGLARTNDVIQQNAQFDGGLFRTGTYVGVPEIFICIPGARFSAKPDWYFDFEYDQERARGFDFREDLFSPGTFTVQIKGKVKLGIVISTRNPEGRNAFKLFEKEKRRRQHLVSILPCGEKFARTLTLAADQFLVQRSGKLVSIIAGYHWFADWGRDAMVALPGLCLTTRRYGDAKKILQLYARNVSRGMLPNRFPDSTGKPEYNTVDAALWFFLAAYRYLQVSGDDAFVGNELLPLLQDIVKWHERGTRYNIRVSGDGMLWAGDESIQLTWMDARIGDQVVTPRSGKAVEINALWFNSLKITADLCRRFGRTKKADYYDQRAEQVKNRFQELFWNEKRGCLYDVIRDGHRDESIRPNQILSLSLPFPLFEGKKAHGVLETVEQKLLTPFGLRSLSPEDRGYKARYEGDASSRDSAYHQGTVWTWLLGPFIDALIRFRGKAGRIQARSLLKGMEEHMAWAGIGSISEIFDAEPPHTPRGCIAQAWSVAEILRTYSEVFRLEPVNKNRELCGERLAGRKTAVR
jgi:predicted glycogen debranching enzyme